MILVDWYIDGVEFSNKMWKRLPTKGNYRFSDLLPLRLINRNHIKN
jgi:hypothetical protein